jgi:hypothetical protein
MVVEEVPVPVPESGMVVIRTGRPASAARR